MLTTKKVSVFLPFYNEEDILETNTKKVISQLEKSKLNFEIYLVNDSSKDSSGTIAKKLTKDKRIKYLYFDNGPSRRENLALAFLKSKNPILLFMDIDLATDISYLEELISAIEKDNDVATGSRYLGIKAKREFYRKFFSTAYNLTIRILFNSKIKDHQCGFKAFKRESLFKLIKEMGYDQTFTRGWFWDAELLIRAQRKKLKIKVIPVKWICAKKSSFNFLRELKVINYMLKLRWRLL